MGFRLAHTLACSAWLIWAMAHGQGTIWHFGDGAGLDFNSGAPVTIPGGASYSLDNSTTATDTNGELLFYSNGESVWDATHTVMPNGAGLLGDHDGGQCALAVHQPGTQKFYLFTVDNWNGPNGLRYSIVDMDLNGGLGDVTLKNQLLWTPSTERLEAVRNPSDGSWWLISHDWNNSQFRVFRITATGLDISPVISAVGAVHSGNNYDAAGQLTASPSGTVLCCGIYDQDLFQVFDFDPITGIVSNARNLPGYSNAWGCAFSPNNQRLYLTKWYDDEVWQVNLAAGTWSQVQNSAVLIGTTDANVSGWQAGFLQLAADDRIYMATFGESSIARIAEPDALGAACDFEDAAVDLGAGICKAGLCRTATNDECVLSVSLPEPTGCAWSPISVDAVVAGNPATWTWDLGDGTTSSLSPPFSHTYVAQGSYLINVTVSDANGNCIANAQSTAVIGAPETAGADTSITLCETDPPLLLSTLLTQYADANGAWSLISGEPIANVFDPAQQPSSSIQYIINGVHCGPDTAYINVAVVTCMGLREASEATGLVLWPNPTSDRLRLQVDGPHHIMNASLLDMQGRVVSRLGRIASSIVGWDISSIAAGHYTVVVQRSDGQEVAARFSIVR